MPVIKSAIKKLRKDHAREARNNEIRNNLKRQLRKAHRDRKQDSVNLAFSLIDKAAKQNIIHKNKAARLKASFSRLIAAKSTAKTA